jgi:hypothetical protein
MTVVPLEDAALEHGQLVDLPEWKSTRRSTIAVGQPARFAVLQPASGGKYRVELVVGPE